MTTVLRSGGRVRSRLFWSALLVSATLLGVLWASRADPGNHQQLMEVAVTMDALVVLGLLALLWKARKAKVVER